MAFTSTLGSTGRTLGWRGGLGVPPALVFPLFTGWETQPNVIAHSRASRVPPSISRWRLLWHRQGGTPPPAHYAPFRLSITRCHPCRCEILAPALAWKFWIATLRCFALPWTSNISPPSFAPFERLAFLAEQRKKTGKFLLFCSEGFGSRWPTNRPIGRIARPRRRRSTRATRIQRLSPLLPQEDCRSRPRDRTMYADKFDSTHQLSQC